MNLKLKSLIGKLDVFSVNVYLSEKSSRDLNVLCSLIIHPIWILSYLLIRLFGDNKFFLTFYNFVKLFNNPIITGIFFGIIELVFLFFIFEMTSQFLIGVYSLLKKYISTYNTIIIKYLLLNYLIYSIPFICIVLYLLIEMPEGETLLVFIPSSLNGAMAHFLALLLWWILPPTLEWFYPIQLENIDPKNEK